MPIWVTNCASWDPSAVREKIREGLEDRYLKRDLHNTYADNIVITFLVEGSHMPTFCQADLEIYAKVHAAQYKELKAHEFDFIGFINSEEAFTCMRVVTDALELPAIAGVVKLLAEPIMSTSPNSKRMSLKRCIGTIVCEVMEANGYVKTGLQRAVPPVPARIFSAAEVYKKAE